MTDSSNSQLVPAAWKEAPAVPDAGANPFKILVDPEMRWQLRRALIDLINLRPELRWKRPPGA